MSQPFDYLKFRCASSGEARCTACPRDFILATSAVIGVFKDQAGKAVLALAPDQVFRHPLCAERLRMIETTQDYDAVANILDGSVYDFGDVQVVYFDDTGV